MRRRAFLAGGALLPLAAAPSVETGGGFIFGVDEFRLIDVIAPARGAPFAAAAGAILADILKRGRLDLADRADPDRWSRRVVAASVETGDGVQSVQELLCRAGGARVRPESDDHAAIGRMLEAESEARSARRGLWALDVYAVRDPQSRITGDFALIQGLIVSGAVAKGRAYLNFGADYRTDTTATAASRDARRWAKQGLAVC
jgi:endonuclease YncB( thermonuclease family)